ncbi:lysosomal membrane ascorbate-dependent ferrireductase CYB561A3 isoform X2 [Pantherophis guttatus]|uniref:Lysosomal membrane ascorbate-dependent ferrireductase CYB561A3 n=1 Tax=Pantherophis guttatus TaxID=94885 RepID=A0A6P9C896_PANGU|nr:lysosomal membrane ascorbate-dependent ferrireductase CYB561A3 isoform X2 [Pantherophis guttatus]
MSGEGPIEGAVEDWNYFSRLSLRLRRKRGVLLDSIEMPTIPFLPYSILMGNLGILCLGLTVYWSQHLLGGLAWDGSHKMFNWHPVLMVTGMVVLYGAAALVYRLPLSHMGSKLPWKVLHATLALIAFISAILGLEAVFKFHNVQKIPNMYSLHSWLGLSAVLFFSCQWLMGFVSFLWPWTPIWFRALYKPVHVFFGSVILVLAIASCISGINEKLFMKLKNSTIPYSKLPPEAWFANVLGMLILVFGVLVLLGLAIPGWKRPDVNSQDVRQPLLQETR